MTARRALGITLLLTFGMVSAPGAATALPGDESEVLVGNPFVWESQPIATELQTVNAAFSDVASYLSVDSAREVFHVSYSDQAEPARIDEYVAAIASIESAYPIEITARSYTLAHQNAVAGRIAANPAPYEEEWGGKIRLIAPQVDGSLFVRLGGTDGEHRFEVDGIAIRTQPDTGGGQLHNLPRPAWAISPFADSPLTPSSR